MSGNQVSQITNGSWLVDYTQILWTCELYSNIVIKSHTSNLFFEEEEEEKKTKKEENLTQKQRHFWLLSQWNKLMTHDWWTMLKYCD